jgi:hypothetical protein
MSEDRFFERLRADAAALRHEPDELALRRIRARIRERVETPTTVFTLLAAWFRPLAATFAAVAIAAAIGAAALSLSEDTTSLGDTTVEITMAGDTYRVPN